VDNLKAPDAGNPPASGAKLQQLVFI